MTEKRPPQENNGERFGALSEAFHKGRRLDQAGPTDKAVNPALQKLVETAEGQEAYVPSNPVKDIDGQPAGFEFKGKRPSPKR